MKLAHETKRREREFEMLEQELFTARLSDLAQKKTGVQMQVNQKRRELRDLETTLRKLTAWTRNFDSTIETEARKVEKLRHHLDTDTARAIVFLTESLRQLNAYSNGGEL
jgi:chromosome segregation ATPase